MTGRPGVAARRTFAVHIHDLDPKGRGVGRVDGKTTFHVESVTEFEISEGRDPVPKSSILDP